MPRNNYSAETKARPQFDIPKPLPLRQRDADGNYLPDPPLPEPYPGYSMMAMIEKEKLNPRLNHWRREPDPPAVRPTPASSKKKGRRRGK